ncbi:MAG: hypothetical protein WAT93_04850, partial [Pontixanthobacter sp.]
VMLYFDALRRAKAFSRVAEVIRDDGWLMLGAGESVTGSTKAFDPAEGNQGLYVRSRPAAIKGRNLHPIRQSRTAR